MTQHSLEFGLAALPTGTSGGWLPRLIIFCYTIALLAELCRLRRGGRLLRTAAFGGLLAGLAAHSTLILNQILAGTDSRPVGAGLWFLMLAWGLVVLEIFLFFGYPKTPFGVFLLPAVFLALLAGTALTGSRFREAGPLFGVIHGISLLTASVFLLYGFVTGVMFFLQRAKIKSKAGILCGVPFPSLEWLRKSNRFAARMSLFFLGLGVAFGLVMRRAAVGEGIAASDDLMVFGGVFLFFLLALALWGVSKSDPGRSDSRIALLSIVSFVILIFILGYGSLNSKAHWLFSQADSADTPAPAALEGGSAP